MSHISPISIRRLPLISVCVCTINRHESLTRTISKILSCKDPAYEIIIIDQSSQSLRQKNTSTLYRHAHVPIRIVPSNTRGLSIARNIALQHAQGEFIVYTDDDCLPSVSWVRQIRRFFRNHPSIYGVVGSAYPYQPEKHKGNICPATYTYPKKRYVRRPAYGIGKTGFGNNMAFRKEVFKRIGLFKEWLGPNAIGSNADDAEFALRMTVNGLPFAYMPAIRVFHDRWMTPTAIRTQQLSYDRGEAACFAYYAFQGYAFAKSALKQILSRGRLARRRTRNLLLNRPLTREALGSVYWILLTIHSRIVGIVIGWFFAKINPIHTPV